MTDHSRWAMNTFKASDGLEIAYALDDYTDPWRRADTLILVHAAMGSSRRFYTWVPHLARDLRETIADRVDIKQAEPGFVDWFIAESSATSVELLARFVPMMRQFEVLDDLHRIRCPTLAVAPGGDPIHTVDQYRVLQQKIPNCEFIVYEGLPHNITDAAPDRCAAELKRFLLKHASSRAAA